MYYFRHLLNKFLRYKICTLTHPSLRINILNSSTSEAIIMCTSFAQSHGSHLRMHALHCSNFYCRRHQLQKSIKYKTKKKKASKWQELQETHCDHVPGTFLCLMTLIDGRCRNINAKISHAS